MVLHSAREESEPTIHSFSKIRSQLELKPVIGVYIIMKSTINVLLLLAFTSLGWVACESSSVATADEEQTESALLELEALVETASKTANDTDFSSFEDRTNHPCYNADSAAVRHEAKATMLKFESEISALAFESWSDNKLITRVNNLQIKKLEGLARFEEATGQRAEVLAFEVGSFNNTNLDALYAELAPKITDSEIEAVKALAYVQELLISLNGQKMQAKRANMEALRARLENGDATACDSARVANFRERAEDMRQNGANTPPERPAMGQDGGKRAKIGGPMLLKYVVKYLENEGVTYEPQLISSELYEKIMTAKGNRQQNGRRQGQQRRG